MAGLILPRLHCIRLILYCFDVSLCGLINSFSLAHKFTTSHTGCDLHTTHLKFRTLFQFLVTLCVSGCYCTNSTSTFAHIFSFSNEIIWISCAFVAIDDGVNDNDRTGC